MPCAESHYLLAAKAHSAADRSSNVLADEIQSELCARKNIRFRQGTADVATSGSQGFRFASDGSGLGSGRQLAGF